MCQHATRIAAQVTAGRAHMVRTGSGTGGGVLLRTMMPGRALLLLQHATSAATAPSRALEATRRSTL